jgi:hypothetical protein
MTRKQSKQDALNEIPVILQRFDRPKMLVERCNLCNVVVSDEHPHLIELATRDIVCTCSACATLFGDNTETGYKSVPDRIRYVANFQITTALWESLLVPIGVAFFIRSTARGRVIVVYPGPTGATDLLLTAKSWNELLDDNPVLREMEPDAEALIVNRLGKTTEAYLVPIDQCDRLAGVIRRNWHGLAGGAEVWNATARFFTCLKDRSQRVSRTGNA